MNSFIAAILLIFQQLVLSGFLFIHIPVPGFWNLISARKPCEISQKIDFS